MKEDAEAERFIAKLREYPSFSSPDTSICIQYAHNVDSTQLTADFAIPDFNAIEDDFQMALAIMAWVNGLTVHGGYAFVPLGANNLYDLLRLSKKRSLTCFNLAILMVELCLVFGLRARFIRCRPVDYTDIDCHVVTHIHIPSLHKWVLLDPTYNLFYMDSSGVPMGAPELREALRKENAFSVYPGAKYNGIGIRDPVGYLNNKRLYMAKNSFWYDSLDVSCNGAFDKYCQSDPDVHYIFLAPDGFDARRHISAVEEHRLKVLKGLLGSDQDVEYKADMGKWAAITLRMAYEGVQCSAREFWDQQAG